LSVINQLLSHVIQAPIADINQFSESDLGVSTTRLKAKENAMQEKQNHSLSRPTNPQNHGNSRRMVAMLPNGKLFT